jgi:hypothetical protein
MRPLSRARSIGERMRRLAAAFGGFLLLAACGALQPPPEAVPSVTREGATSVRILHGQAGEAPHPEFEADTITPAFASDDNKLPEYPAHALKAGCRQGVVPIRVTVGVDGNVAIVTPIPDRPVEKDQCHSAFWAATCAAVQEWRFAPAFRQTPKPGPDFDGDGRADFSRWEQTPIAIYLDFEFTFRVVEGRGEVFSR